MKIIKHQFLISDYTGPKDKAYGGWAADHGKTKNDLCNATDVEKSVNKTLNLLKKEGHEVVDVRTDFVTVHNHSNGGCNTVIEFVTILYK